MSNSNTFSRDNKAAKSNKGIARPKDKIIGNSSTEDWLNDFDDDLSMMGYRDDSPYRERSSIDIHTPNGMIDMSQTGIPLMANGQYLPPYSGIHNMGTPYVREERMAKYGGWLDQYAPGGTPGVTPFRPSLKPKTRFPTGSGRYSSSQGYIDADKVSKNSAWFNPEAAIEEYLGYPQQYGENASLISDGPPVDNIRHSVASYKTSKAIADKTKPYLGNFYGNVAGVLGSNALGLAHEIHRFPNQMDDVFQGGRPFWNTIKENAQDLYNNAFGSLQVFNGMTPGGTTEYLKQQSKKGKLAKGAVDDNAYHGNPVLPKEERVLNDNTRVVRKDGGDLKQYQGDVDGSQVTDLSNQFIYPSAFQYAANTPLQNRAQACQGPDCLAGANTYYNKYVAPKFGLPTSWKMLENYGIVSGDASKPYGVSMDSWDAAAEMQAKGAIQNYAAPLYEDDKKTRRDQAAAAKYWKSKTDEEKRNLYSQLALGSLVNFGDWGGIHGERLQGSNEKAGLYPSRHSTRVIGFTEDGVPMIYDMGQIRRIDDPRYDFPITNITTPKELSKYNYQYVKDWEANNNKKLNYNPKEKLLLAKGSQRAGEDSFTDEEFNYVEGINKNIKNLMAVTGSSQEDIIKAGKVAFGIMQGETRGGRGELKAKGKEILKNVFDPFSVLSSEPSKGLTRIKPEMQAGDETNKYSQYLKSLNLDPKNLDLWDPEQAAIATTALILSRKGDIEGVDKWYLRAQQHNTPGVGPKNEQRLKEADKDYASNVIKNTARLYSTNTGYGLPETEKWMTKKQSERLKQEAAQSKKEGAKAFSEALKPKVMASESTGYSPKFIPISQLTKKEMGGESGWLDEYDLPRAQTGLQAVSTYPSAKEQNTLSSMSDERRAYEQNLANEKANREYNAIKGGLNIAGLFYYPASVAASALEFSEGNYGQGAVGLVPFVGPASKANAARNILNQASRNLLTKSYNAGIPYKIAAPIIKGAKKTTMYGANAVNAQDAYDAFNDLDEQRYGGVKQYKGLPKGTTKNLVRGINKLFLPDPKLFGPFGRKTFDPNSKFEYGGWLDDLPKAQMYNSQVGVGRFGDLRSNQDNTRVFVPNLPKKPLTKAEQQEAKQYAVKQASRDLQKANEKLAKIQRIRASDKAQKEQGFPTTRQEWADQTQATGDKLSLQNLPGIGQYVPDILDVTGGIGSMASSLGSAPLRAQQEDSYMPYLKAIGAPLFQGALAGVGAKNTGQFLNNVFNPFAGINPKGLRRKPVQNAEFDPNHYEFSNPEMTDYFAQQPKRDLAEARIYEKKAAEDEQWLQQLEQDRLDALASQYSDDELEGGIELFGDSDDFFGAYRDAVGTQLPSNIPNTTEGIREQAMANLVQRDMPNIQPLNITPPSSIPPPPTYEQYLNINTEPIPYSREEYEALQGIRPTPTSVPPPPTYEQYLDNASHAGTTPLSREQYDYINNTPTPPLSSSQTVFPTDAYGWPDPSLQSTPSQGWMGIQEPDWIRNAPGLFGRPQPSGTGPIIPTPRAPKDDWADITENLKQNKKNTDAVETVKKELAKDKNVTGRVEYSDVASSAKHTLLDKSAIPSSDKIDGLINNFEEVLSHTPQDHKLRNKLVSQVEDLKSTKWLREEYAKELEAQGLKPQKDLSIVTSSSNHYILKHLVDKDGNIIASIDINPKGYVGSSGLAHEYHGANLKRLNFENEIAAQTALEERLLKRNKEALQNSFDRGYLDKNAFDSYMPGIERSAQEEAAKIMERVMRNNNNKFGEGLYRGVHHGIKDTKGGLKSNMHFVETNLENPITGLPEAAYRGKLGWQSWAGHINPKAVTELDAFGRPEFRMIRKYGGWLEDYE